MAKSEDGSEIPVDIAEWVPIFPLPNGVLLPRTVLPLHVFEKRYRIMTEDALRGNRRIAMAMLEPGYEPLYHTLDVPVYPVVCIGRILREERLGDGRYNFLLQGLTRALILTEDASLGYRRAVLKTINPRAVPPQEEAAQRRRIKEALTQPPLVWLAEQAHWNDVLACPDLSFSDLLDVLASVLLTSPFEKYQFLAEPLINVRADVISERLNALSAQIDYTLVRPKRSRAWPPTVFAN